MITERFGAGEMARYAALAEDLGLLLGIRCPLLACPEAGQTHNADTYMLAKHSYT